MNKSITLLLGPTAVGKTALGAEWAMKLKTAIISADSRQCFKELNIGVAKPSPQELQLVHHYFISSHSISDTVNAAVFEQLALGWAAEIFEHNETALMVGGTGLYVKAFCEGLDEMPSIDPLIRNAIQKDYDAKGIEWLKERVKEKDPDFFVLGEIQNPQRLMRALEVQISTGRSLLSFRTGISKERNFSIKKIGLQIPREDLHRNINYRVDQMMDNGLVDEVKALMPYRDLNALRTVGYSELFEYLDGKISLDEAIDLIKKNTRHYAKRQMTWFKKDPSIQWMLPAELEKIIKA